MNSSKANHLFYLVLIAGVFLSPGQVSAQPPGKSAEPVKVFVSILPQVYFVERVGGDRVAVSVMVGPGQSPATYEPRPKQMADLSQALFYFRIGVPFESAWIERIRKVNPRLKIVDTRRGIELRPMKPGHGHGGQVHSRETRPSDDGRREMDPHIWLSLRLVKKQAENICRALVSEDPAFRAYYEENLRLFSHDLDRVDQEIAGILSNLKTRKFMVFHPTWGYFARDYGLEQVPIESEGKEPSARELARVIKQAGENDIRVIFVQEQFSTHSAEVVARSIGGRVVPVNPLSEDYLNNMRKVAETFREVMQ